MVKLILPVITIRKAPVVIGVFFLLCITFLESCKKDQKLLVDESLVDQINFYKVDDLDFSVFENSKSKFSSYYNKTYDAKLFIDSFYMPWHQQKFEEKNKIKRIWEDYFTYEKGIASVRDSQTGEIIEESKSPCFTGNFREYSPKYLKELVQNLPAKTETFLKVKGYGITTETAYVRGLPTNEFCFKSIRNCGEGYPFDYLQYTSLWVATPLAILEKSNDGMWYFVKSPYSYGWVSTKSIALINQQQIKQITNSQKVVALADNIILKGKSNNYKVFAGTLLPFDSLTKKILFPLKLTENNRLTFDYISNESNHVKSFPAEFNKKNVKTILSQMIGTKYSWGGIDEGRDCSSTLKDYFSAFGIWFPRNSGAQRFSGDIDSLEHTTTQEKIQTISEKGIPFISTLYLPGHIVMYLGKEEGKQIKIFHTIWGLKTYFSDPELYNTMKSRNRFGIFGLRERENNRVETRSVIGKTVITDIELEKPLREIPNLWVKPYLQIMETLTNPVIKEFQLDSDR